MSESVRVFVFTIKVLVVAALYADFLFLESAFSDGGCSGNNLNLFSCLSLKLKSHGYANAVV